MQEQEIWKTVDGFNGDYKVSNLGNLIMFYQGRWQPKAQYKTNVGYMYVTLIRNGKKRQCGIHRLVAEAFVEGKFEGAEVNHKDLDKTNNRWDNLEWVTHKQNQQHQVNARNKKRKINFCSTCGKELSSCSAEYCLECWNKIKRKDWMSREELKQDLLYMNMMQIGRKYNKADNTIRKICMAYDLPYKKEDIIQLRKENGVYVSKEKPLKRTKEERFVHYDIDGVLKTAQGWSLYLGLEGKRIGRYANKHTYEETINYIKSFM